jgi:hypothetical protein
MYCYFYTYVFLLLCMQHSVYSVSLFGSVYCFCVNVCCTAAPSVNPIAVNKYMNKYTGVPPYLQVIRSKTYRGNVKPRIIPNAIYNVTFV